MGIENCVTNEGNKHSTGSIFELYDHILLLRRLPSKIWYTQQYEANTPKIWTANQASSSPPSFGDELDLFLELGKNRLHHSYSGYQEFLVRDLSPVCPFSVLHKTWSWRNDCEYKSKRRKSELNEGNDIHIFGAFHPGSFNRNELCSLCGLDAPYTAPDNLYAQDQIIKRLKEIYSTYFLVRPLIDNEKRKVRKVMRMMFPELRPGMGSHIYFTCPF